MEYQTFVGSLAELPAGKEIELVIRDLTPGNYKYRSSRVIAVLSNEPFPRSHTLRIRGRSGMQYASPFYMRIVKKLPLIKEQEVLSDRDLKRPEGLH